MLYPQKGSIANGSRRTWPIFPNAAAVISEPIVAAAYTPNAQLNDCCTSGTTEFRRPPNTNAETGTPFGSSKFSSTTGHWVIGAVKRAFGCAAVRPASGVQSLPCQSIACAGGSPSMPSHQTSPSSVSATFVKITFAEIDSIAFGFVL